VAGVADGDSIWLERLRREAGLREDQLLRVRHSPFSKQAEAINYQKQLIDSGQYEESQLGLFAEETSREGQRRYHVNTFAGFAAKLGRQGPGGHFNEVILENRPCWLYFDLDFSKVANPQLDKVAVLEQFRTLLRNFCFDKSMPFNESLAIYLDSSTDMKFSWHVIVKAFAFKNNAQAGQFVAKLLDYARQDHKFHLLFVRGDVDDADATVPVVDTAVYSRNRCFRVISQTKFGKAAALKLQDGGSIVHSETPTGVDVLLTLASLVPTGTPMFEHTIISAHLRHRPGGVCSSSVSPGGKRFLDWLIDDWDNLRSRREGVQQHPPTKMHIGISCEDGCFFVRSDNNKFCCQKGRSHKSNGIFFKVNPEKCTICQGCYDSQDCRHCMSKPWTVPSDLLRFRHAS